LAAVVLPDEAGALEEDAQTELVFVAGVGELLRPSPISGIEKGVQICEWIDRYGSQSRFFEKPTNRQLKKLP
jgi:hypothetical protein